jgi:hypothetical protein
MHKFFFFIISSLYTSTCFENYVLVIRRSKLCYTVSGIVTLCRWLSGAQVERVLVGMHFDLLMTNKQCSKHVETYNKLIIKQEFVQ